MAKSKLLALFLVIVSLLTASVFGACGDPQKPDEHVHTPVTIEGTEPTCTKAGLTAGTKCSGCGKILEPQKEIAALGHNYDKNGICTRCKDPNGPKSHEGEQPVKKGNKVIFGSYPQSRVDDRDTQSALAELAGELPAEGNNRKWTGYGYYISGAATCRMWYIDLEYREAKYRGVYFLDYRPTYTNWVSSDENSCQDENGYAPGTLYWFRFEPLEWSILQTQDGISLLICDSIIDSQEYYITGSYPAQPNRTIDGNSIYENNYKYSTVRKWLNETFYKTAFTEYQQSLLLTTDVDNSAESTSSSMNDMACENTKDKVFLLSFRDIINGGYGYSETFSDSDGKREKQVSDYAKSQGAYVSENGSGYWWLRSPFSTVGSFQWAVLWEGKANANISVHYTAVGIVPAIRVEIS